MAQSGGDLPRFVISKVDDATRPEDVEQPPPAGDTADDDTEARSTDTPVNGNLITTSRTWLNGLVVSALGIRARRPGFDSAPIFHWVKLK